MSLLTKLKKLESGYTEIKKNIKIGSKSLLMTIREDTNSVNIYIGGHELYCLNIFIKKEQSIYSGFNPSIAHLPGIEYNSECSLEYNFKRGIDTNMILKFAISYIYKNYPHVKGLSFNDASYRSCDNGNTVSLAIMSYIASGKTWYETHFGAYLEAEYISAFKSAEQRFQESKKIIQWEIMKNLIGKTYMNLLKLGKSFLGL